MDEMPDLVIDPEPVTIETFFCGAGRSEATRDTLALRGDRVEKSPFAADDAAIAHAEARLGVRLPRMLRRIYAMRDGDYVGPVVVPRVAAPRPVFEDWCGVFAPDYSSLRSVDRLETMASSYADMDVAPEDIPPDAARLVILEARYGNMTLLDYTQSDRDPGVLLVDFDRSDDPVDMRFTDFDPFLAGLRRDRWHEQAIDPVGVPLADAPEAAWPGLFWDPRSPAIFRNIAEWHMPDRMPAGRADETLLAATERRMGARLPPALRTLLGVRNGGGVAAGWLGTGAARRQVVDQIAPVEFWVSLAELSRRVVFPPAERPWAHGIEAADGLIVLDAKDDRATLLDHRGGAQPDLVIAHGLAAAQGMRLETLGPFEQAIGRLRFVA